MSTTETSPFAPKPGDPPEHVITVTDRAVAELIRLRDAEPEGDRLGVRVEILSDEGIDFSYDLSFQIVTKAALTDVIRNHSGLKVIVPERDVDNLTGATLDFEPGGLVLRNPNRPKPFKLDDVQRDDEISAEVEAVIDGEVNPALAAHGGFITYVGHDGQGKAFVTMGGGCHGCSMSRMTMLSGVQEMIVAAVQPITKVVDVTDHATGENPYYS
jgi:Fe/S biogenesis protein NfuA